eukprot:3089216-Pyramimonas_sp.AAC.1
MMRMTIMAMGMLIVIMIMMMMMMMMRMIMIRGWRRMEEGGGRGGEEMKERGAPSPSKRGPTTTG